jgi:hypothetical protein
VAAAELGLKVSFYNFLGEKSPELAAKIENPINDLEIELPKERWPYVHARTIVDVHLINEMAGTLGAYIWVVAKNATPHSNYTSDHPVVRHAHSKHPVLKMCGVGSPGVQFTFPLSPQWSLSILERTFWKSLEPLDRKALPWPLDEQNVSFDNSTQVAEARRFVYCREDDFDLVRQLCKQCPEYRNPDRPVLAWRKGDSLNDE